CIIFIFFVKLLHCSRFSYYSFKPVTLARLSFPFFLLFVQTGHIGASIVPVFPVICPNRSHWIVHRSRFSYYSFKPVTLKLSSFPLFLLFVQTGHIEPSLVPMVWFLVQDDTKLFKKQFHLFISTNCNSNEILNRRDVKMPHENIHFLELFI